jgi:class 3 adenylate cyclase
LFWISLDEDFLKMETEIPASPIKRRLTAILAADAVGYSRQMSENEEGTLQVLMAQRAIIDRLIVTHEGRIFGTAGDSVLAEFPSSVEAVRCAVEIQEAIQTRNQSVPEKQRLEFRIGVNLGDVMVDGSDILGDGVNVAARLESIADPGGIYISSSVYDQIAGKLSLGFVDLGERSLKNITRPIRVYRLDRSGEKLATDRRTPRFRKLVFTGSGAMLLVLLGIVAWQAGLFDHQNAPARVPPVLPERPTPLHPLKTPSEVSKLRTQIAEAERAKAEAELARTRAETELAKQQAASLRAERKPEPTLSSPKATSIETATSPAATTTVPAPPPAAPGVSSISKPPASTPVLATVEQKPPLQGTSEPQKSPASDPTKSPSSATTLTDSQRGVAILSCESFEEVQAFSTPIPVRVSKGEIVIRKGYPDKPGYLMISGRPTPDGKLVLSGTVVAVAQRLRGKQSQIRYEGSFRNGQYELIGFHGRRRCTMTIRIENQP